MFRPAAIRRFTYRLRTLAIWAMIPLAALNGRTVSGCICSDGHFETACDTAKCAKGTNSDGPAAHKSCGCSCCSNRADKQGATGCCLKMTCCSGTSHRPTPASGGDSINGKGCCQPVSQTHVTPTVVVKSDLDAVRPLELLTTETVASLQSLLEAAAHRYDDASADLCSPPDLVITLRKLVI